MTTGQIAVAEARPKARRQEDTEPWYRQFWPWFLIALPGSVVVAGLSTVYIAYRYSDDLVVDSYYKNGLAINIEIAKQQAAADMGVEATLRIMEQHVQIRLAGDVHQDTLQLQLSHPLEADRDFGITLDKVAKGLYDGDIPALVSPNWHWIITSDDGSWRLDGSLDGANFINSDG